MTQAQIGLLLVTPAIVAVAVALHHHGALNRGGAIAASLAATAVGVFLFLAQ